MIVAYSWCDTMYMYIVAMAMSGLNHGVLALISALYIHVAVFHAI